MNWSRLGSQLARTVWRSLKVRQATSVLAAALLLTCQIAPAFAQCAPGEEEIDGRCVPTGGIDTGAAPAGEPSHREYLRHKAHRARASASRRVHRQSYGSSGPSRTVPTGAWRPLDVDSKIVDSGYAFMLTAGSEQAGFGLYTYVLLTKSDVSRSKAMIAAILQSTQNIIEFTEDKHNLNVLYIPAESNKTPARSSAPPYNYQLSRSLLDRICTQTVPKSNDICQGDLSAGPYLFTYPSPLPNDIEIPPPLLFVDLSGFNSRVFPTYIAAYKEQVKQDDITDMAKINTLKLKILSIAFDAADLLPGFSKAYADSFVRELGKKEEDNTDKH